MQNIIARATLRGLCHCELGSTRTGYEHVQLMSRGVAENFLMEKECLEVSRWQQWDKIRLTKQYFGKCLTQNYLRSDLSYGDSLWGSRRINRALSGFYNESVRSALPLLS